MHIKSEAPSFLRNRQGRIPVLKKSPSMWEARVSYLLSVSPLFQPLTPEMWSSLGYGPGHLLALPSPCANSSTSVALPATFRDPTFITKVRLFNF